MNIVTLHCFLLLGCLGCTTTANERTSGAQRAGDSDGARSVDDARSELAAATRAEDEAVKALDAAVKARESPQVIAPLADAYRRCIEKTDLLVNRVFTQEVIDATPWTDLLSGSQKDQWQHVAFEGWTIRDGVLDCAGPMLDAKQTAIMSIGDLEQWRDFVLDVEFTLVQGESAFHFRLGPSVNNSTLSYQVRTSGDEPFATGVTNPMTVSVIGSAWKVAFPGSQHSGHEEPEVPWTIRRKGAIAVSVPPGSAIRITRMRIEVLR